MFRSGSWTGSGALVYELLPDHKPDDPVFFPLDSHVDTLRDTSPLERAVPALGGVRANRLEPSRGHP